MGNRPLTSQVGQRIFCRDLHRWREVIPEYVKEYVSLNQFAA
jgi:hypothetical protein